MAYFPFYMDVEGMVCLIAGGGKVASRKIFTMLEYGAAVRVIAPEAEEEIAALAEMERISYEARACVPEDVDGADFVIAATSDEVLNRAISRRCKSMRIPVNVVDVQEECSFIFPALVKDGDIVVGISTGGASPAIARMLKDRVRAAIPEGAGAAAGWMKENREMVKALVDSQPVREEIFYRLAELALSAGGGLEDGTVKGMIERKLEESHG